MHNVSKKIEKKKLCKIKYIKNNYLWEIYSQSSHDNLHRENKNHPTIIFFHSSPPPPPLLFESLLHPFLISLTLLHHPFPPSTRRQRLKGAAASKACPMTRATTIDSRGSFRIRSRKTGNKALRLRNKAFVLIPRFQLCPAATIEIMVLFYR